jgi:hypothetical protein
MQLTTSSGTSGGTQSNATLLLPTQPEPLSALPPNGLGPLADTSGTLKFRTRKKEPRPSMYEVLHPTVSYHNNKQNAKKKKLSWLTLM